MEWYYLRKSCFAFEWGPHQRSSSSGLGFRGFARRGNFHQVSWSNKAKQTSSWSFRSVNLTGIWDVGLRSYLQINDWLIIYVLVWQYLKRQAVKWYATIVQCHKCVKSTGIVLQKVPAAGIKLLIPAGTQHFAAARIPTIVLIHFFCVGKKNTWYKYTW